MKVLLIGANGQLGSDLVKAIRQAGDELIPLTRRELDVCDLVGVSETISHYLPDIVINTAAFHKVDLCEDEPERAFAVNTFGVRNVALACRNNDAALVHIGTDYVFDGRKTTPYVETDCPNPINVYGTSKLAGEHLLRYLWPKHFIVRTAGLYGVAGPSGKGTNFVELMLRLASERKPIRVVNDQTTTPTPTISLAHQIVILCHSTRYGLYHATAQGQCTWYEFAREIFRQANLQPDLSAQTTAESGARALRPTYSVLENARLKQIGLDQIPEWRVGLADYMRLRCLPR